MLNGDLCRPLSLDKVLKLVRITRQKKKKKKNQKSYTFYKADFRLLFKKHQNSVLESIFRWK